MGAAVRWTGKAIRSMSLHKGKLPLHRWDLMIFIVLFGLAFNWCYQTAGEPLAQALAKIQAEEEAESEGETTVVFADDDSSLDGVLNLTAAETAAGTDADPWAALAKAEESGVELPYEWQPDFWPLFSLAVVFGLLALWYFGQMWSVDFKCTVTTQKASSLKDATLVKCVPRPHRGKAALVPLEGKDTERPFFLFQKQRYEWDPSQGLFVKVVAPVSNDISFYLNAKPPQSRRDVDKMLDHYGENKFDIPLPTFGDMYKEQITSPFFVFQMFCILLWCLEEYWQYSLFNLAMILGFEATVTTTRRLNIQKLRGMGNKATTCQVWRVDGWSIISTEKLVPGDRVRLRVGTGDEAIIPCDCLLLAGTAIVNESTLTGESVPLMKEAISMPEKDRPLEIKGQDKVHILYGGTQLMEAKDGDGKEGCCECYVLRTGFSSSQGKLVRKIEFSTEKVSPSSRDAAYLLLFLLIFALASSGYVLHRGLAEGKRTRFDLLVHCILIITSVVPPDLPMQMALAIQTSLATLMKLQVFCTEPHRIPMAGTITTDRLNAAGFVNPDPKAAKPPGTLDGMMSAGYHACLVVGGCHSLVLVQKEMVGDPLETASINSIGWRYSNDEGIARPLQGDHAKGRTAETVPSDTVVKVLHRHHFSSKLQRMSVVATVKGENEKGEQLYILAKGSPEMVKTLLSPTEAGLSQWYDVQHRALAKAGYRVIALAYKKAEENKKKGLIANRSDCEKDLKFAGFIAFNCLNRTDSSAVLGELQHSGHHVIMITGDAILTAAHVGTTTNILPPEKSKVLILARNETSHAWEWVRYDNDEPVAPFRAEVMAGLAKQYALCVAGDGLEAIAAREAATWSNVQHISVFARMKPEQKEAVLLAMRANGLGTLMCGDGTNDVGALKAADVGVALLSGFGDVNAEKDADKEKPEPSNGIAKAAADTQIVHLGEGMPALTPAQLAWVNDPMVTLAMREKRREQMILNIRIGKRAEELRRKGVWAYNMQARLEIAKEQGEKAMQAAREEAERRQKGLPAAPVQKKCVVKGAAPANPWDAIEEQGLADIEMVKLGDASIAAPFTSKMPSIRSTVDIIRQGRATLLSTLQMYQILALNCLISSYSLSVLYLDGMKYGDRQMTAQGILATICFLCISRGAPLPQLSPVHPPTSIFHPALFISMLGQFAIHLSTHVHNSALARDYLPEDFDPDPKGKFTPNVFNTVVFLTSCTQQVSVFFVNYKGRPFMENIFDNTVLMIFLLIFAFGTVMLATESLPFINRYMELQPLSNEAFKSSILTALVYDFMGCYFLDRLTTLIFMPEIWKHSMPTAHDFQRIVKMTFWAGVIMYLFVPKSEEELQLMLEVSENATATE